MSTPIDECITPGLKPIDETIREMLDSIDSLDRLKDISVESAVDRIIASPIESKFNFPPWPASAMDGYAFKFTEDLKQFHIVGSALAGHPFDGQINPGECIRITTGAPLPTGCDTVEMQENCEVNDSFITLKGLVTQGQHVRQIGSSISAGQVILDAGIKLGPKELAIISSSGIDTVTVYEPLRVAIFTTGDELSAPGIPLEPGKIYDSNRLTMLTMCKRMGFEVLDYGLVADDPEAIESVMLAAAEKADVLMTSGGVSVGDADYIKPILEKIGELTIWKVAIKPGKPIAIGSIGDCRFFGLPGNPVSTIVTLNKLVQPALQKLAGQEVQTPTQISAICHDNLRKAPGRRDYQRGVANTDDDGNWQVKSTGPQGSGRLVSVVEANCYIVLEPECSGVTAGERVTIELFDQTLS